MKNGVIISIALLLITNIAFAQKSILSPLKGRWVNTQYEYFTNHPQLEKIMNNISPWFISIDSTGRCTIELLQEQRADVGYPIASKNVQGVIEYHYKKHYDVFLYSVRNNDSLLIYSNGITPGAGIVFKRYNK